MGRLFIDYSEESNNIESSDSLKEEFKKIYKTHIHTDIRGLNYTLTENSINIPFTTEKVYIYLQLDSLINFTTKLYTDFEDYLKVDFLNNIFTEEEIKYYIVKSIMISIIFYRINRLSRLYFYQENYTYLYQDLMNAQYSNIETQRNMADTV